jgi:hypothetical protein
VLSAPARHATLASPGALRAVVGIGFYLSVVGLLALGIAVLVRHTAGAISAYVGVILVLPIIVSALPGSLEPLIERLLPVEIGSVMRSDTAPHAFVPRAGFFILCGYTVLILALPVARIRPRGSSSGGGTRPLPEIQPGSAPRNQSSRASSRAWPGPSWTSRTPRLSPSSCHPAAIRPIQASGSSSLRA